VRGMDWLKKYNGVIHCARQAVQLPVHTGVGSHQMHIFIANIPTFHSRYRR
jgi:hypothetical protein